jgi:anti-sigma B factor antagonist
VICVLIVGTGSLASPLLVSVAGEIDSSSVGVLRDHLQGGAERDVVLELSEVTLLSAAGLTVLLELQDRLHAVGARVVLAGTSRPARRVLRVTGLDDEFVMAPTVEDAIEVAAPDVPAPPPVWLGPKPRGCGAVRPAHRSHPAATL